MNTNSGQWQPSRKAGIGRKIHTTVLSLTRAGLVRGFFTTTKLTKRLAVKSWYLFKNIPYKPIAHKVYFAVLVSSYILLGVLQRAKVFYVKLHAKSLARLHIHLHTNVRWYNAWHNWQWHRLTHVGVLAVYVMSVGSLLLINVARTFAADSYNTWDFSNSSDYTVDNGLEIQSQQARMKAQNYADDSNTKALYHLDEASGTNATDSSSHANDGTVSSGTFGSGNLNNGLSFNGTNSSVSVPDSSSLSLSQANTIEGWSKLSSAFSAGSSAQRQPIVDKGDYALYYDNETGKVAYELANGTDTGWTRAAGNDVNGSWDTDGKSAVTASVAMGGNLYAGLGAGIGDAEVWRWNGSTWSMIGGDGVNDSWADQTYEYVYAIESDGTNIYAGLGTTAGDAEVWKWNGSSWTKIGGDAVNSSWAVGTYEIVGALNYFGGNLYAGLGNSANDAEVWRWNGTSWTKIGGDSTNSGWTTNYELVGSLVNDGTNLYAGLGTTAGDGEVWRWNGSTWSMIGGDGVSSSWNTNYETVRSLYWAGGALYAGLGDSADDAEVWRFSSGSWTQIGGDSLNSSWGAGYEGIYGFSYNSGTLYAGLGTSNGDGEVYSWNGTSWTKIGGDGVNSSWATAAGDTVYSLTNISGTIYASLYDSAGGSYVYSWNGSTWTLVGGQYVNDSWGYYGEGSVETLFTARGNLYAGMGSTAGNAQVWEYNGDTGRWHIVGGQGLNNSWAANTYELITSMNSYNGNLVVGVGNTANDAEVWSYDGSSWTKIGGDSTNSGWTTNYEEVNSLASYGGYLYAGLGNSANDAEVWRWNGTSWTKIGGDSTNSGWTTNYERVSSMTIYNGMLYVGLGASAGDGEVWRWSGSSWAKVGGDSINSGWDATIEQIESMVAYNGKLYAGLGNSTGDATLWQYNGSTWTKIGGDEVGNSWASGTYENIRSMTSYNGDLYTGLGNSAGDGEAWKWDGSSWTKIGGNSLNNGWGNTAEEVESMSNYRGKLYVGTGNTANADAAVWSWGNNGFLQSSTNSFDTNWHHIAGTYDGSTMRLYVDGVEEASQAVTMTLSDSDHPLLIGAGYGGREQGKPQAYFNGMLDEVRISDIARPTLTTKPYTTTAQTVSLATAALTVGVESYDSFDTDEDLQGGTINYRLSNDDGTSWKYWNGSDWVTSSTTTEANDATTTNAHIGDFPVTFYGLKWQAVLLSNGNQRTSLQDVTIGSNADVDSPDTNAQNIVAYKSNGGQSLASNGWTNSSSPYFNWTPGSDSGSGIRGYCLYLGTDNTADPISTKGLLGTTPAYTGNLCQFLITDPSLDLASPGLLGTAMTTSSSPYYLRIKAIDNAGNISASAAQFQFRFDNTPPSNPGYITAPSGFINTKETTLTWPTNGAQAPTDANSGLAGLQYRINSSSWYGDSHSGTGDASDLLTNDGSYQTTDPPDFDNIDEGVNTVYFRTWDQAGNVTSSYVTATLKVNTSGAPSEPQNLDVNPSYNTENSFSFDWDHPNTFVGDASNLTYCYTINVLPSSTNCTYTNSGVTSLGSGPYATQPGSNTLYLVARDESSNINYANYTSVNFTANTPAPGIPGNVDIVDVSIKATAKWRLALTWEEPSYAGSGISNYRIYRSINNTSFSFVGSSSSTTYIDAGLSQQTYYYYVEACDNTNNCGAHSTSVSMLPTGKFTEPATLTSNPNTSNITTKKASINWTTDRASDSKIAIGTTSGKYGSSEIGNSDQVTSHTIQLDNLAAGTTYYYVAKWTDEDGNTGTSQEYTFTTAPAPVIGQVETLNVGLTSALIQFSSKGANKVNLYYGPSDSFGGLKTINTSSAESQYNFSLEGLSDGTKYYYRLSAFDGEGSEYLGNVFTFTTPPRPRITNLRFQPVPGEPTSTQLVSWETNVPSTSTVTYGKVGSGGKDLQNSELQTSHQMRISNLEDDSTYFIIAQGRDRDGNLAVSDRQQFRTALDTRPPKVSEISVESSVRGTGAEARGQVVISWKTDEPSMSQVGYTEGSNATVFNSKTAEDSKLTTDHLVIVSDLPTSKVYSMQPLSKDKAGNVGKGEPQSAIIGRASESVLTIILNTLQKVFGL